MPEPSEHTKPASQAKYSVSAGFVGLMAQLNIAVALTSYQSGRLYLLGRNLSGGLMVNEQVFQKAMGLFYRDKTLYLATLAHVYRMTNILRPNEVMDEQFTDCFIPRTAHFTGILDAHDVGVSDQGTVYFVNTRYNCIAELSDVHSFKPVWKPRFVSTLISEDRCHLNGLAMQDGAIKYASAVSKSDTIDGWRDRRADGGVIIDVQTDEIVCQGLSMPHSPRVHNDRLWVLNSGTGELGWVDLTKPADQNFTPLAFCPGFVRGLSFHGNFAFVGLSKPRYERFEGLALDDALSRRDSDPWCGLQVIDLTNGRCVEWFRIDGQVEELYDIEVLPDITCPRAFGFLTDDVLGVVTAE